MWTEKHKLSVQGAYTYHFPEICLILLGLLYDFLLWYWDLARRLMHNYTAMPAVLILNHFCLKKKKHKSWRDDSVVKSAVGSSRIPGFDSQTERRLRAKCNISSKGSRALFP